MNHSISKWHVLVHLCCGQRERDILWWKYKRNGIQVRLVDHRVSKRAWHVLVDLRCGQREADIYLVVATWDFWC